MRNQSLFLSLIGLLAVFAWSSCDEPVADPSAIEGPDWQLISYTPAGEATVEVSERPALAKWTDGQLSGTTGCNRMGGEYTLNEATLECGPLFTTKMACRDLMQQERLVLTVLQNKPTIKIQGGQLHLTGEAGELVWKVADESETEGDETSSVETSASARQVAVEAELPDWPDSLPVVHGMFAYFADAANFVNCEDMERYPVAMEGRFPQLEQAYLDLMKDDAGKYAFVTATGRFVSRNKADGPGQASSLVIDDIHSITRDINCKGDLLTLTGSYHAGRGFTSCEDGSQYPVEWKCAVPEVESALFKVEGFLLGGPAPEGDGSVDHLHVTRIIGMEAGRGC